jgi:FtsX-like permease family
VGSILVAAWGQVLRRARADWLVLSAAWLTILLATTLLSAGPIYGSAVSVSGLRRTLQEAPLQKANVQVSLDADPADYPARDAQASRAARQAFAPIGAALERSGRSSSFALPGQSPDAVAELMVFAFFRDLDGHAHLVQGRWPRPAGAVVEAAVPAPTARRLGLGPGDQLTAQSRTQGAPAVAVRLSGVYQVDNPRDPFWWGDQLDTRGVEAGGSFTTYGPFVTDPGAFFGAPSAGGAHFAWRIYPAFARTEVSMLPGLGRGVDGLAAAVNRGAPGNDQATVETGLATIVADAERSLLVTQAGVLIVTLELAVLAGYALLLTAGMLVDQRAVETGLLNARGASGGQVLAMALMEAAVLALPAAVAGPWLAALSLEALNRVGPLAGGTVPLHPEVSPAAYALSVASAAACVVALALPARRSARSFVAARASRGRQPARGLAQRARIDLVLVAAAVLGLWQLRLYGTPITQTVQGSVGIDPLLVAAPAIGLLAGAVIALRAIPLLARAIDAAAPRIRPLVPALGAWQLARRPLTYSRSALLLMLAFGIGVFALSYGSTWARSQQDQADYQVGADVRLQPDVRPDSSIPALDLGQAHRQLPGVAATMPVLRDTLSAGGGLLAVDAAQAGRVVSLRPGLATAPLGGLMERLVATRPHPGTIPLAGTPQRVAVDLRLTLDPLGAQPAGPQALLPRGRADLAPTVRLTVRDGRGLLYELDPQPVPADGATHRLAWGLADRMSTGRLALPEYPLSIAAAEVDAQPLAGLSRTGELELAGIESSDALDGGSWSGPSLPAAGLGWTVVQSGLNGGAQMTPVPTEPAHGLAARFVVPAAFGFATPVLAFRLTANGGRAPDALPALASQQLLDATASRVGDTVSLDLEGRRRDVRVVGALRGFPTLAPEQANLVVDLPSLETVRFQSDGTVLDAGEWWLAASPGRRAAVARALGAPPYSSVEVDDRADQADTLRSDPVALGTIGALSLGSVAAALFAALGFVVNATLSSWSRQREFALLRAVGLSPAQLSGWLALENAALVAISLVGGTMLGLAMAWLILPTVSLTQGGSPTVPEAIVVVPWRAVSVLEGITVVALLLAIAGLAAALRRLSLGAVLRLGEE